VQSISSQVAAAKAGAAAAPAAAQNGAAPAAAAAAGAAGGAGGEASHGTPLLILYGSNTGELLTPHNYFIMLCTCLKDAQSLRSTYDFTRPQHTQYFHETYSMYLGFE
jgi:hypothetical protein